MQIKEGYISVQCIITLLRKRNNLRIMDICFLEVCTACLVPSQISKTGEYWKTETKLNELKQSWHMNFKGRYQPYFSDENWNLFDTTKIPAHCNFNPASCPSPPSWSQYMWTMYNLTKWHIFIMYPFLEFLEVSCNSDFIIWRGVWEKALQSDSWSPVQFSFYWRKQKAIC